MIRLERYGLVLTPLTEPELEMVRTWRNAPHVRANFEHTAEIGAAAHRAWFEGLDPRRDLYLVIRTGGTPAGVVHAKDIDWEARTAEAGIFMDAPFLGTETPVLATLALMELTLVAFTFRTLYAKLRADRPTVVDFNRRLGYRVLEGEAGKAFRRYRVTPEAFREAAEPLLRAAARGGGAGGTLLLSEPFWQQQVDVAAAGEAGFWVVLA